ncbi:YbhN family protein [Egicoccus sp. AB-alg2]|uniref:lysylphosphatidylglycerol synthase transmembrane domain-containing protein n=1 Tax=Egicoccus sp. AB-alg2 TaxID=3242693 RepID=UPI00359E4EE0
MRGLARGPLRKRVRPGAVAGLVERGAVGVRDLATDRRALLAATGWAAANWLLDVAVVVVLASTIGAGTPLTGVLLAYIVAQLAASVPLTPGGVGIVETAMVGALVGAGAPAAAATVTVLGWRLVSHWLPIVVGLALLPGLRNHAGQPTDPRTT